MSNSPITPTPAVRTFTPPILSAGFDVVEALKSQDVAPTTLNQDQLAFCKDAVKRLREKMASRGSRSLIDKEFESLVSADKSVAQQSLWRYKEAKQINNQAKNRYVNVLPYDDTRVKLAATNQSSDYINASYIQDSERANLPVYISTQGPLKSTVIDFWEMVLQNHCPVIVMLTRLVDGSQDKCSYYFPPERNDHHDHGTLTVTNKATDKARHHSIIHRIFEVQKPGGPRHHALHLEYLDWPDFGAPSSTGPVRDLMRSLKFIPSNAGPVVVHCSAGIGRTGTFCAIDHTIRRILSGDKTALDICQTIKNFRTQRYGMVQTRDQLRFCYEAVCDELEDLIRSQQPSTKPAPISS